jgi:hypothetical protein
MDVVALALWIVTAVGGLAMAGIWLINRGPVQHAAGLSRISPMRLGSHFGVAGAGLLLWIGYIATDTRALGWVAFALLPIVAVLGVLMFMTWLAGRGAVITTDVPAEQKIPPVVVAAHGLFALATVIAVLWAVAR